VKFIDCRGAERLGFPPSASIYNTQTHARAAASILSFFAKKSDFLKIMLAMYLKKTNIGKLFFIKI